MIIIFSGDYMTIGRQKCKNIFEMEANYKKDKFLLEIFCMFQRA